MPYQGELANKASHFDLIQDPEIENFLYECNYLQEPSEEEGDRRTSNFTLIPNLDRVKFPEQIIAIDGSPYCSRISDRLPDTEVGYVKISSVLIKLNDFDGLKVGKYVDPFKVAKLLDKSDSLKFILPSANICWNGQNSVVNSFRAAVDKHLYGEKTRFDTNDPKTSLRTTLFYLASKRPSDMGTGDVNKLKIHKCPNKEENCKQENIEVFDKPDRQYCPQCGIEVYPSDCLRLWEEINEWQSNEAAINRFMGIVEHLLPIHYVRNLAENSLSALSSTVFFLDRPLGIFGTAAWLHKPILNYLSEINGRLAQQNKPPILIIGLQKTGQVVDYVGLIDRFIEPNTIFAIDDDYRYKYIVPGRKPSQGGFGSETYYGQDFIYKTSSGRTFIFALPYPFKNKELLNFSEEKIKISNYQNLPLALALINKFECDLYENAVIPIALANQYTAISLVPGGKVLDILTQQVLNT
jgi:hypothetical protein